MPDRGLPDDTCVKRMLKRRRLEKPFSEEAKKLKSKLASVQEQMRSIKAFNANGHINFYCDQLELEVRSTLWSRYSTRLSGIC